MMKKTVSFLLAVTMCLTTLASATTIATAEETQIKVTFNGEAIEFDQPPIIENGSTLVPMRAIFEAMGATVEWHEETQRIEAKRITVVDPFIRNSEIGRQIIITIGADTYSYGGIYGGKTTSVLRRETLDTPATIVNGRTLVPVRAIAEGFGATVEWDSKTQTVIITSTINPSETVTSESTQGTYYTSWPTVLDFGTFTGAPLAGKEVGTFGYYYYTNGTFAETGEASLEAYSAALLQEGFTPEKAIEGSDVKIFAGKGGVVIQIVPGETELEINMQRY